MEVLEGRYELGEPLGHGRSTVYRATDTRLRRAVAIKRVELLAGHEEVEQVRARALREAQASARLNNPSAVAVYDVVEDAGAIWLVMELVDGPSLAQLVADGGPLPHDRAARLGLQVLTALEAAHLAGVVHRDVKPANVLVTDGDRAKLTDFGVATIRDESRVTLTGIVVGSPSYMAPEQATAGEITPATDLWALGALLYFAVEGEPPFLGGTALATAAAVVHEPARAQRNEGPLSPIIARLLTKDPAGRPTAGNLRATLTRVGRDPDRRMAAAPIPPRSPAPARPADAPGPGGTPALDATAIQPTPPRPEPEPEPPVEAPVAAEVPGAAEVTVAAAASDAVEAAEPTVAADATDAADAADAADVPDAAVAIGAAEASGAPAPGDAAAGDAGTSGDPAPAVPPVARRGGTGPAPRVPVVLVAAVAVVVLAIAVMALRGGDGGGGDDEVGGDAPTTTTEAPADPTTSAAPPTTAPAGGTLPDGWVAYADPAGAYTLGHPPGWQVQAAGANRTDFRDPATGTFVRVEWTATPGPDAAGAWYELEPGFRSRNAGYERLGITPVAYRDYPAALWEFRHGQGEVLHTGNLGFLAAGRGYALMLRAPESQWDASQAVFEQFKQSFQPT
jgi:tRNA A-37 threonylcarbamoyl transferase component Bud32